MLEVTPDVLTCQGKSSAVQPGSEYELETMWNRFAGAMTDMADVQAQRIGTQTRDTQWNLPSRNSLGKIKTLKDTMILAEELASNRTNVLDNAKSNFMEVLFKCGWTLEDATIYCEQGGLIMLVTRTYDNLYALVQQIIGKAFQHPDAWDQIGQPRVDHHASQLGQFRMFSNRRVLLLCQNYMYLRDGQACGYQDLKLSNKLTEKLMNSVFILSAVAVTPGAKKDANEPKKWLCTHCHGDFHTGGSAKCDLKDEDTKTARKLARKIDLRLAAGETDKTKVVKEVREAD
jgi:hypothetical protein